MVTARPEAESKPCVMLARQRRTWAHLGLLLLAASRPWLLKAEFEFKSPEHNWTYLSNSNPNSTKPSDSNRSQQAQAHLQPHSTPSSRPELKQPAEASFRSQLESQLEAQEPDWSSKRQDQNPVEGAHLRRPRGPADECREFSAGSQHEGGGVFTTPGYPNHYPLQLNCTRVIQAKKNNYIVLDFREIFDLEDENNNSGECGNDKLEIRDGRFGYSKVLARLCGSKFPPEIRSSGEFMWLRFVSDSSIPHTGFKAHYKFVPKLDIKPDPPSVCHFNVTSYLGALQLNSSEPLASTSSSVASPGLAPNGSEPLMASLHSGIIRSEDVPRQLLEYTTRENVSLECIWNITVMQGWRIYLTFTNYELSKPNDCDSNFIEIYENDLNEENQTVKFCGTRTEPQQSKSNVFNIRHFAIPSAANSKFVITYTAFRDKGTSVCDPLSEFDCDDGTCIHDSLKCNGVPNCKYRYDENSDPGPCTSEGDGDIFDADHMVAILIIFMCLVTGMCASIYFSCAGKIKERRQREPESPADGPTKPREAPNGQPADQPQLKMQPQPLALGVHAQPATLGYNMRLSESQARAFGPKQPLLGAHFGQPNGNYAHQQHSDGVYSIGQAQLHHQAQMRKVYGQPGVYADSGAHRGAGQLNPTLDSVSSDNVAHNSPIRVLDHDVPVYLQDSRTLPPGVALFRGYNQPPRLVEPQLRQLGAPQLVQLGHRMATLPVGNYYPVARTINNFSSSTGCCDSLGQTDAGHAHQPPAQAAQVYELRPASMLAMPRSTSAHQLSSQRRAAGSVKSASDAQPGAPRRSQPAHLLSYPHACTSSHAQAEYSLSPQLPPPPLPPKQHAGSSESRRSAFKSAPSDTLPDSLAELHSLGPAHSLAGHFDQPSTDSEPAAVGMFSSGGLGGSRLGGQLVCDCSLSGRPPRPFEHQASSSHELEDSDDFVMVQHGRPVYAAAGGHRVRPFDSLARFRHQSSEVTTGDECDDEPDPCVRGLGVAALNRLRDDQDELELDDDGDICDDLDMDDNDNDMDDDNDHLARKLSVNGLVSLNGLCRRQQSDEIERDSGQKHINNNNNNNRSLANHIQTEMRLKGSDESAELSRHLSLSRNSLSCQSCVCGSQLKLDQVGPKQVSADQHKPSMGHLDAQAASEASSARAIKTKSANTGADSSAG